MRYSQQARSYFQCAIDEDNQALAHYLLDNPIAVSQDMIDFVRQRFGKDINKSCVGHAIKTNGILAHHSITVTVLTSSKFMLTWS